MSACPALLSFLNSVPLNARLVMTALAAVLLLLKVVSPPSRLVMSAVPALLVSKKLMMPPFLFTMVAALAVVPLKNCVVPPSLVIDVMPAVLALTTSNVPSTRTLPRMVPVAPDVPSCRLEQKQMTVPPV